MESIIETDMVKVLKRKYTALQELFKVTNFVKLTGESEKFEKEAQEYVFLMEKRSKMVEELNKIEKELRTVSKNRDVGYRNDEENTLQEEIQELIQQIIEVDKKNMETANKIFSNLKESIKNLNLRKNMNNVYQNGYGALSGGLYDRSN